MTDEAPVSSLMDPCRSCGARDLLEIVDLGMQPPAADFPRPDTAALQASWPLIAVVCRRCWLFQLRDPTPDEGLASSIQETVSSTMQAHAERFVDEVLGSGDGDQGRILEMASHGGHLAPRFSERGVRTLIVDPSPSLVDSARAASFDAEAASLTPDAARAIRAAHGTFDVVVDNYLLAHQRQLDPQLAATATLLAEGGRAVLEFNHLLPILRGAQFDAIRHGHFTYLSLISLMRALERHGLHAIKATVQPVYGGGVRLWMAHHPAPTQDSILRRLISDEEEAGLDDEAVYRSFAASVTNCRNELLGFLIAAAAEGRRVVGYGAPSRGSTLLNACGITPDLLAYTVDASASKQGRLMPGSRIPIVAPARIAQDQPDDVLILTWDIADEVVDQLSGIRAWGGRFVTPFPRVSFR